MSKDIEIYYSQQSSDFIKGRAYGNPRFFSTPRTDVSKVFLVGDWPKIRAAYEAMGVPVEQIGASEASAKASAPPMIPTSVATVLTADERAAVEIPDGWRELPWTRPAEEGGATLRGLSAKFAAGVLNREQAFAAVEAELDRRAQTARLMAPVELDNLMTEDAVQNIAGEAG